MRYRSPSFRYWTVNVGKSTSLIQIQTQAPEKKGANAYATRKTTVQGVLNTAAITRTALMLKDYINDYESTPIRNTVIVLCCIAILVTFATGILFVFIGKTNWENKSERAKLERMNTATLILVITSVLLEVILGVFDTRKPTRGWKLHENKRKYLNLIPLIHEFWPLVHHHIIFQIYRFLQFFPCRQSHLR